jgi:hypothetical protein
VVAIADFLTLNQARHRNKFLLQSPQWSVEYKPSKEFHSESLVVPECGLGGIEAINTPEVLSDHPPRPSRLFSREIKRHTDVSGVWLKP